ncbi:MAG: vWA domain-containing protein [Nanoarchaeota archaeon]|mgnify:CR=1 FL=1
MINEKNKIKQKIGQEFNVGEAWNVGMKSWNNPSIPTVISVRNKEEREKLGKIGQALGSELAFMKFPEFQTYENLERILEEFPEDPQRALKAINKHEVSHRFCPYDLVTFILLFFEISKALKGKASGDEKEKSNKLLNLFTDMNGNTNLAKRGDEDIPWLYENLSRKNFQNSSLGRVYARSMELAWKKSLLPEETKLTEREQNAAKEISKIYSGDYFNKSNWRSNANQYASIMSEFLDEAEKQNKEGNSSNSQGDGSQSSSNSNQSKGLMKKLKEKISGKKNKDEKQDSDGEGENKEGDGGESNKDKKGNFIYGPDDISSNIPDFIDDKTATEIAKRLAEIGTNSLPTNPHGLKDYKDLMAGFGRGDPKKVSLEFYEMLAKSYDVIFSTQPFGRPRVNPFQPVKWNPGMPVEKLDVDYSFQTGGKLIPGVTTYAWNSRRREFKGGLEEIVPDLDIYLDSSQSMINPTESISIAVLASIVLSKKANRKGAKVRGTNFSGENQYSSTEFTRDLTSVLENFMTHYNGGTILPVDKLLESTGPKQVVIITDTYLANKEKTASTILELIKKDRRNKVTIYAVSPQIDREYLENAGAEVIQDTSANIFKKAIGKANEVYGQ